MNLPVFNRSTEHNLLAVLVILSLAGAICGIIPISPIILLILILLPACLFRVKSSDYLWWAASSTFLYYLASAIFYDAGALTNYDFYRNDGNFFPVYAALLVLPLVRHRLNPDFVIKGYLLYLTGTSGVLFAYFLVKGNPFKGDSPFFQLLFDAHNAAGGVLATGSALAFPLFWYSTKFRKYLWGGSLLCLLVFLYETNSRGSLLALIGAMAMILLGRKLRMAILAVFISIQISSAVWGYIETDGGTLWHGTRLSHAEEGMLNDNLERGYTIIVRAFALWATALSLWIHSPFFGTGFGSFDDNPYFLRGMPYLFSWNHPYIFEHSQGHAHNTYFHLLADTGLIGFALLISLQFAMWKEIQRMSNPLVRASLLCAFWTAIFASGTEHRFTTPSQMLPFLTILGVAVSYYRWERMSASKNHVPPAH